MHAYKMYACKRCTSMSYPANDSGLIFTPPKISHTGRHCVGWHAVVCYGAPEWYRFITISTKLSRVAAIVAPCSGSIWQRQFDATTRFFARYTYIVMAKAEWTPCRSCTALSAGVIPRFRPLGAMRSWPGGRFRMHTQETTELIGLWDATHAQSQGPGHQPRCNGCPNGHSRHHCSGAG